MSLIGGWRIRRITLVEAECYILDERHEKLRMPAVCDEEGCNDRVDICNDMCRKVKYDVRRLDLHRILSKLLDMRRYTERVHNIVVSTDFAEGPLWIRGDSSHLKQLFMNLMLNAEEAVKESGGGHIKVTTRRYREWVRISVSDDARGIPPENLKQVFYPFFTTKDVGEGTGLGLSTCYGIVTNHNGLIRAENNEAGGATFTVELPMATSQEQPPVRAGRETGGAIE